MLRALLLSLWLVASTLAVPAGAQPARARLAVPAETRGEINGKPARFVAEGDDILLTTAEASRLGIAYRAATVVTIGPVSLWQVRLASISVGGRVRQDVPAGVVVSIRRYIDAIQDHSAEASAKARETEIEIGGRKVRAFDFGIGGYLVSIAEAERAGIRYREGRQTAIGAATLWSVEVPLKMGDTTVSFPISVADPKRFFEAMEAKTERSPAPTKARQ